MKVRLAAQREVEERMMRDVYASTLIELAAKDERVVVLDADLMSSMGMMPFGARPFPSEPSMWGCRKPTWWGWQRG